MGFIDRVRVVDAVPARRGDLRELVGSHHEVGDLSDGSSERLPF